MAIAGYNSSFLVSSQPSVATTFEPTSTTDFLTYTGTNQAHRYFDPAVAVVVRRGFDEVQQIQITGSPTGGTFTLTFGGQTTAAINWNDTAATIQTRLQALSSIGANNCTVTGGPGPATAFVVEFKGTLGLLSQALITLQTNSLTGGTSPSVSITEITAGAALAIITTGFTVFRCNLRAVFAIAQVQGTVVKMDGSYFPYTTLGEAAQCEFSGKIDMLPADTFQGAGGSGAKIFVPGLLTGTMKTNTWWLNNTRCASLLARDLIIVSFVTATNNRYEGFCYAQDCNIKADPKSLVGQDLTFQLTNEFFNA